MTAPEPKDQAGVPLRVVNLGCKVNRVESDTIAAELLGHGFVPASEGRARLVVVNTCTVTAEADAKTRKTVRHLLRTEPLATLVVTGCSVAISPEPLSALGKRVVVEADRRRVAQVARDLFGVGGETLPHERVSALVAGRTGEGFRTRVGIKVQDGCPNACTYCIVHVARGVPWCKPEDEVVAEVRAAEAAGAGEVVLSGINLGSVDDLGGLLERLLAATSHVRVRLSSIEPCDVTDHLVDVLASCSGRVCRHLHIPLQSGCDETLREMARPYDTAFFSRLVSSLREQVPSIALTTDVMAGFPGESDEQFEQSLSFCAEMAFSKMHVFRYSRRPGTPAATRLDQVEPQVKATRARRLRKLSEQMRRTYAASLLGTRETVLVESAGRATAERYLPCVSADGTSFGHDADGRGLVPVEVVGTRDETLVCQRLAVL